MNPDGLYMQKMDFYGSTSLIKWAKSTCFLLAFISVSESSGSFVLVLIATDFFVLTSWICLLCLDWLLITDYLPFLPSDSLLFPNK